MTYAVLSGHYKLVSELLQDAPRQKCISCSETPELFRVYTYYESRYMKPNTAVNWIQRKTVSGPT